MVKSSLLVTAVRIYLTITCALNERFVKTNVLQDNSTGRAEQLVSTTTEQRITVNKDTTYIDGSTNVPVLDEYCSIYGTCDFPANEDPWYCQCDDACEKYNDCCLGYNRTEYTTGILRYECLSITSNSKELKGYFAISVCPDGYTNKAIRDKCRHGNIPEHGPSVVHNNSEIYKNKYCALCNNVTNFVSFDVQFYNLKLDSDLENYENYTKLTSFQKINFTYFNADYKVILPKGIVWRFCLPRQTETTDPYCQLFINPALTYIRWVVNWYRNINCVPFELRLKAMCFGQIAKTVMKTSSIKGLSVIFSFRNTENIIGRNGYCGDWSEEVAATGKCSDLETYQNYRIDLEYYLKSGFNHTEEELIMFALLSVFSMEITNLTRIVRVDIAVGEGLAVARITVIFDVVKRTFIHEIRRIKQEVAVTKVMRISIKDNAITQYFQIQVLPKQEYNIGKKETKFHQVLKATLITETLKWRMFHNKIHVSNITANQLCRDMVFDVLKQENGYNVLSYNCQFGSLSRTKVSILSILTYTCSSLSAISLLVLIVHNRKRKLYLSIPGSNLENLSLSLLLSYVVFMAGIGLSSIRRLCYIIGIILHYLWLSVFSFMTISVVFIFLTLVQIKSRNAVADKEITNRRRALTLLGLLLPILFVGPAVGVDQFGPSYLSSGYGKSVCFPNQFPANVIFFSGPVILSVFINSICLVNIIIQISKVRAEMRHIRKSVPFQDAKAYLRIAILCGIFWITGVLAAVLRFEWLEYIFTILCGLQGFGIAVANLTTSLSRSGNKTETGSGDTKKAK